MSEHTPGPWEVAKGGRSVNAGLGKIRMEAGLPSVEIQANMRLIAAAPELLEACREAEEWARRSGPRAAAFGDTFRRAIAKATKKEA